MEDREIEIYTAERLRYEIGKIEDLECIRSTAKIDVYLDEFARNLVATIRTSILSMDHELQPAEYVRVPASWWQHFKQSLYRFRIFAPLARWSPVEMEAITVRYVARNMCPHIAIPDRNNGDHFRFMSLPPMDKP